jgi:hypothetical protein
METLKFLLAVIGLAGIVCIFVWPGALLLKNLQRSQFGSVRWRNILGYFGVHGNTCPKCGVHDQLGFSLSGTFYIISRLSRLS